jgi:hypothetical protein
MASQITRDEVLRRGLKALTEWYDSLRSTPNAEPKRGLICIGLAVLEHLRDNFPLQAKHYLTEGNQVKRTGGPQCQRLLARFGEARTFLREGGRTTRGSRPAAESLAGRLNAIPALGILAKDDRDYVITELQRFFAQHATDFLNTGRIEVEISIEKPVATFIADILRIATSKNVAGAVAQHLVGAKLALRFPDEAIGNYSSTTADEQLGRVGDFQLGDTAIHVTVTPMQPLFDKIADLIRRGYRSKLLVPEGRLQAARQLAELAGVLARVEVVAIESFVSQNLEELAAFDRGQLARVLRDYMSMYNERVAVETNPALLLHIPDTLQVARE